MSAYLEFHIKGGGCAVVEAGSICGVIGKGHDLFALGAPDAPTLVVFRGSENSLEVIGESVGGIIGRMITSRELARTTPGASAYFDRLTPMEDPDAAPGESRKD